MRNSIYLIISLLVSTAVCMCACRRMGTLHSYKPVNPRGWSCTDTLCFELQPDSMAGLRTYSLGVRFTERFAYRGIWLVLEQRALPTENALRAPSPRRDTLYLPLANENGRWEAEGVVCHSAETVCTKVQAIPGIKLQLLVYHIMPQQEIEGISEVGLKVE